MDIFWDVKYWNTIEYMDLDIVIETGKMFYAFFFTLHVSIYYELSCYINSLRVISKVK